MEEDGQVVAQSQGTTMMARQLSLFNQAEQPQGNSEHQALTKITWSYSRRSTLEKCVRCYYYDYYGSNKRMAKQEVDKETLRRLKELQNRHERAGKILHLAIGAYFRKKQEGKDWLPDRFTDWARKIFREDVLYSQGQPDGSQPSTGEFHPVFLSEFYYRDPRANELCSEVEDKLVNALTTFTTYQQLEPFRMGGYQKDAHIERSFKLRNTNPCRIEGRIDLAYPAGEEITIVDWKLGVEDGIGDNSLQLATYALWAIDHYHCDPDSLRIYKVHLGSSAIVGFEVNPSLLSTAHARITQDAERMLMLDRYGQEALVKAFTPCLQPGVCKLCSYRNVCKEAKEAEYA
jgi:hypothetical protein